MIKYKSRLRLFLDKIFNPPTERIDVRICSQCSGNYYEVSKDSDTSSAKMCHNCLMEREAA